MPQMQIGRRGVKASLDTQRAAGLEPLPQIGLYQQLVSTALDQCQLGLNVAHRIRWSKIDDSHQLFAKLRRIFAGLTAT